MRASCDLSVGCSSGQAASLEIRQRSEAGFGWLKTIGGLRKTK